MAPGPLIHGVAPGKGGDTPRGHLVRFPDDVPPRGIHHDRKPEMNRPAQTLRATPSTVDALVFRADAVAA